MGSSILASLSEAGGNDHRHHVSEPLPPHPRGEKIVWNATHSLPMQLTCQCSRIAAIPISRGMNNFTFASLSHFFPPIPNREFDFRFGCKPSALIVLYKTWPMRPFARLSQNPSSSSAALQSGPRLEWVLAEQSASRENVANRNRVPARNIPRCRFLLERIGLREYMLQTFQQKFRSNVDNGLG